MKSDAIDKAYKKYHKELYMYALSLCRDEVVAKELVSETFYKALIASHVPDGSFKFWLFRVLKNHFIDVKRKGRRVSAVAHYEETVTDVSEKGPASQYLHKERDERLHRHLITLEPETYREILHLYYYGEMSIKAIAQTMSLSETNAKTLLYRARKKLGRLLKEDSYEF
ncbi:MAG: RNA polymerase sigma factor [Alkalibacterium sp.]|nr:RNA polymerase sigma factor [Alkalibacterium sp.]